MNSKNQIAFDFLKLPSKKLYPDYYASIKTPISLSEISAKVKSSQYSSTLEFLQDIKLMADNANEYNEPDSFIAQNALKILDFVQDQVDQFNTDSVKVESTPKLPKIKIRAPCSTSTPSTPSGNFSLKKSMLAILQELVEFEVDGINIGAPFLEEVSRKDFPDYYKLIKQPMSLISVRKHINGHKVRTIDQFVEEVELIWKNAQLYNEEESLIYQDSITLSNHFNGKIEELREKLHSIESTPSSKKKPTIKLKAKPPKSKLKIHLNVKNEEAEDEDEDEGDDAEAEASKEDAQDSADVKDDSEIKPETGNEESSETKEDSKSGKEELQSIKPTRKRSSKQTAADALIQEISVSSSRSVYKQQVKNQGTINQISTIFQNWFEYRFEANDFQVQSYTLTLPPQQGAVSVLAGLNDSLIDRKHSANLTVNGERVSPIPSVQYADTGRRLTSRYELKLATGLNMVVFDVSVESQVSEESRLRSQDASPNVEKLTFWIQVVQ